MFVDEVFHIVKRDLNCNYENIQFNERVSKGEKMLVGQIKHNYAHKGRSYVEYD